MAAGANAHGLDVAVMSYDLCPQVKLAKIVDDVIACTRTLREVTGRRVLPFGHSAGGHLTACVAGATGPHRRGADLIAAAMPVSGLFHLAPLVRPSSTRPWAWNRTSRIASRPHLVAAAGAEGHRGGGGDESSEYHRQTRTLVSCWGALGVTAKEIVVPAPTISPSSRPSPIPARR